MVFAIRPMQLGDIAQATEIDREAFPTLWPPTAFKRELLHNPTARYLVAWEKKEGNPSPTTPPDPSPSGSSVSRWLSWVRRVFSGPEVPPTPDLILGFVGLWFMVDEAHITTIAVRQSHQRRGLGELLLIAAIDLAAQREAHFVTLEVRASNLPAQALYEKYGFSRVGVRRGYYSDNREDAIIMTTERITSPLFQRNLQRLKEAHSQKWGYKLAPSYY